MSGLSIVLEISLSGRSLVLRGTDLDRMIDRAKSGPPEFDSWSTLVVVKWLNGAGFAGI